MLITVPFAGCYVVKRNSRNLKNSRNVPLQLYIVEGPLKYDGMLEISEQLNIRIRIVCLLAIEVFKYIKGMNPEYLNELLITNESKYGLRNQPVDCCHGNLTLKNTDTTHLDILFLNSGIHLIWNHWWYIWF